VSVIENISARSGQRAGPHQAGQPGHQDLLRGDDGLFRQADGTPAENDPAVRVVDGALEGSNVNAVDSMVNMISLARQFEMQMSLMKNAENNAAKATQILALS
jgi:flagellar basal-body rod protein FlgF